MPHNPKTMNDEFNNLLTQQVSSHFDEFNHLTFSTPFKRNASTSTLDLGENRGDNVSGKSNQRTVNIGKDKSAVGNKLDFNNICGMVRTSLSKSKETSSRESIHRLGRLKPAKNVYFIEDTKHEEPSIFIIDPATISKHKKCQKSLEDIRLQKISGKHDASPQQDDDATIGWNFMDRNYYGSRTLPRDFARRNVRPRLDNFLSNVSNR